MIKFYRNIRQKLLAADKTANYFKYAIGEIILVMIGILLALQVNNWNTNRINRYEEEKALNSINAEGLELLNNLSNKIYDIYLNTKLLKRIEFAQALSPSAV